MFERRERFVTATERRKMRELREQRMPISEIARTVGRPKSTVWGHVHDIATTPVLDGFCAEIAAAYAPAIEAEIRAMARHPGRPGKGLDALLGFKGGKVAKTSERPS